MMPSRELSLILDLQTAVRSMSIATGYDWDVKTNSVVIDADNIFDVPDTRLPFFIIEPSDDGNRTFEPAMQLDDDFVAVITARVDAKGDDPNRRNTIGLQLCANIERVLTRDIERNGLATDTRLRKPQVFTSMSGEQSVIVVVRVAMKINRTYGEPG